MKRIILKVTLLLLLLLPGISFGQIIKTKLDIVGGASAREYFHGGLRYQYSDITQIGFYYGGDLGIYSETINTYAADHMIHFGKHSFYSNRPVWYARQGFTFVKAKESDRTRKYSYVNLSLGRDFAVSDWLGFNADIGMIIQMREKTEWEDSNKDTEIISKIQWMPLLRLQFYISL